MARTPASFRQDDVTRTVRGVEAAGHSVRRLEVRRDGTITVIIDEPAGSEIILQPVSTPPDQIDL